MLRRMRSRATIKFNDGVHPAAASDIDFRKRAIGGSACNALFAKPFVELCETSIQRFRQFLSFFSVGAGQRTFTSCDCGTHHATDLGSIIRWHKVKGNHFVYGLAGLFQRYDEKLGDYAGER